MKNIGGKLGQTFNDGVLSQFKPEGKDAKIVTHIDHLPEPFKNDVHIEDHFDKNGNYKGFDFNIKKP